MNGQAQVERALRALAIVLLLGTAAAIVLRPALPTAESIPTGLDVLPALSGPVRSGGAYSADVIVQANIFAPSRTPPATRYNPFEMGGEVQMPIFQDFVFDAPPMSPVEEVAPHLYGTVVGPDGIVALMRLDPAIPGAWLYVEGDRAGEYEVIDISPDSVILMGPEGRVFLQLSRPGEPTP